MFGQKSNSDSKNKISPEIGSTFQDSSQNFEKKTITPEAGFLYTKLAQDYNSGKLANLEKDLANFIRLHKADIKKLRDTELLHLKNINPNDELAIKLYILKSRSINPEEEIKLELNEIRKRIELESKDDSKIDPDEIAREWSRKQAERWRDYWILCALYVFDRNKEKYLSILNE